VNRFLRPGWLDFDCTCEEFVVKIKKGRAEARQMTWYEKAVQATSRIEPDHTSPWNLASTFALLSERKV
jgi:hypothetical protein